MANTPETCKACQLNLSQFRAARGEEACWALNDADAFNRYNRTCLALKVLRGANKEVNTMGELLAAFSLIRILLSTNSSHLPDPPL